MHFQFDLVVHCSEQTCDDGGGGGGGGDLRKKNRPGFTLRAERTMAFRLMTYRGVPLRVEIMIARCRPCGCASA